MNEYIVSFAGMHVAIRYDDEDTYRFLSSLFKDVQGTQSQTEVESRVKIIRAGEAGEYTLMDTGRPPYTGNLGVHFAALLFDAVIFSLLNKSCHGIALHAGALAYQDKVVILPGLSGYGKSSMTACLVAWGCSYLTDELYFAPLHPEESGIPFTRPLCIKSDSVAAIRELLSNEQMQGALADADGLVLPHRLLNNDFSTVASRPSLILIPKYHPDSKLHIEKLSAAQATTLLMACVVNGRNLEGHGFRQVAQLARSAPAYRINYNSFQGVEQAVATLFASLQTG